MKLVHHDLEIELDNSWWSEAGMNGFIPNSRAYQTELRDVGNQEVFEVCIDEVAPLHERKAVGFFRDNEGKTGRERVVTILEGFRSNSNIPPVEVVRLPDGSKFKFKLTAGCHRFYCSLAAGFTHVPAVLGFDINDLGL